MFSYLARRQRSLQANGGGHLTSDDNDVEAPAHLGSEGPLWKQEKIPHCPAVALDCEMVGGGKDGSESLCARICVVDEKGSVLLHTFVRPNQPVTDYRQVVTACLLVLYALSLQKLCVSSLTCWFSLFPGVVPVGMRSHTSTRQVSRTQCLSKRRGNVC